MIRSILNRSMLAAACVLAIGQAANASALSALQHQDINDSRNPAGKAYLAQKPCPFATGSQVDRDAKSNPSEHSEVGSASHSKGDKTIR